MRGHLPVAAVFVAACVGPAIARTPPTPHLFVTADRLATMRQRADHGAAAWRELAAVVDDALARGELGEVSAHDVAVVYLVSGERRYCDALARHAAKVMAEANPRGDSYLAFEGVAGALAVSLDACAAEWDARLRTRVADYLDAITDELWFHNRGSGWGLHDHGNNYHASFLVGTAYVGYALRAVGDPRARKYIQLVRDDLDAPDGQIAFLNTRCAGGAWNEGANYGQRSKNRLVDLMALIAAADGKNYIQSTRFFSDAILYALHQLQPGNRYVFPSGDMARESNMRASPFDRAYIQPIVYWLADSDARAYGQYYLRNIVRDYRDGFRDLGDLWRDLVFGVDIAAKPQRTLPLVYRAPGDGLVAIRSGWDAHATALVVSAGSILDQSHDHLDSGSFTLWRDGWQAVDAVTYSQSGLLQLPDAHNMISVEGVRNETVKPRGIVHFADDTRASYLQIDGAGQFAFHERGLVDEWTRELVYLKPDIVVVYDRVSSTHPFDWRLHVPKKPEAPEPRSFRAANERGGLALRLVVADTARVAPDTDLGSTAWRIVATSKAGRFLAAIRVGGGGPPALAAARLATTGEVDGVALDHDVVVFSRRAGGAPAPLGWSYELPAHPGRVHTLANMAGSCHVAIVRRGGTLVVSIEPGTSTAASADGIVRFTE